MGPRRGFTQEEIDSDKRPVLRAVILDFSAVASIDTTGVQCLVDTRRQLCKYADREVEFHFANIISPWVRRSLLAGGFGTGQPKAGLPELAAVVPALGEDNREVLKKYRRSGKSEEKRERLDRLKGYLFSTEYKDGRFAGREEYKDLEVDGQVDGREKEQWGPALSQDTPFFHIDIPDLSHLGDDEVEQE